MRTPEEFSIWFVGDRDNTTSRTMRVIVADAIRKYEFQLPKPSPLAELVSAFEQIQRVEQYLYARTYASDGRGSRTYSQWYADVEDAVHILRLRERTLRIEIAVRIGATIQ